MNIRRTFLILVALLIVFTSVSVVSAGLFDGLFGNSQNNITNITDLQFNIPDGYALKKSEGNGKVVLSTGKYPFEGGTTIGGGSKNVNVNEISGSDTFGDIVVSYDTSNGKLFNVTKQTYSDQNKTKGFQILLLHPINGTKYSENITLNKTINGFEGELTELKNSTSFKYYNGDTFVRIIAPDEKLISNIIVAK